jgi:ABC-type lipoprotein export system ATPase subunit
MTLTVVVGSSGSGKTTFLNDVHESHHCTYIRQYHNVRPYVTVTKIPHFDPTALPYWSIYEKEGKADKIQVGGTMAGEFTAGLSGGQRKMLLFELVVQRTRNQTDLLIALDEPFAGVTDDFVPFIVERLNEMRKNHNILLVTNDHVETLTKLADNTITVSAIDRSTVRINDRHSVDRQKAIVALSVGDEYQYHASNADVRFFFDVEVANNGALIGWAAFTTFAYSMFLATFWDSSRDSAALVLVAGGIISFFCLNPYLIALTDWRNFMSEEAEALLHASKSVNKALKTMLTLTLLLIVSVIQFGITNAVTDGLKSASFWVAMLMDSASLTFPFICFGLYTNLPFQLAQILSSLPFLFMIFFSTTFSPGSGVPGLKALRYLFARFYFWCMIPVVQDSMENCPKSDGENKLYLILSALIGLVLFLVVKGLGAVLKQKKIVKMSTQHNKLKDEEFLDLQVELYGDRARELQATNHSASSRKSAGRSHHSSHPPAVVASALVSPPPATEKPKAGIERDFSV